MADTQEGEFRKTHALGTNSKEIEEFYNGWDAAEYDANMTGWGFTSNGIVVDCLSEHLNVAVPDAIVLDAGCGSGLGIDALRNAGYVGANVTGIDIWQPGLDHA